VVTYGGTSPKTTLRMFSIFWKHIDILGSSMGSPQDFAAMLKTLEAGQLRPAVDHVFAMDDVVAAAEKVNEGTQFGKVVLAIG
jgi:NADPH:quinone reductase-like Zn-dependent oxidoreductase